ncbi:CLUMA_CG002308, isoform A [Clunio marinus]|uniref:CLUMA_CG002308, isoform A n=1 Tax=Clunio marinus TaxID=568069 RepID=A0A1J1HKS5_9DIPT|nr:CLUMA_CG002308, isoform A [Clunio marinus]
MTITKQVKETKKALTKPQRMFINIMNQVEILKSPVQSEGDKKQYRLIKLPNGLKALLIHKPENSSSESNESLAAASLMVGVGSFDDPPPIWGLAHFLEHMLFLGSEKYPDDGEYNDFITANGGSSNAFTQTEDTTYYFEVNEKAFPEALDRFAQQFISSLLLRDSINREREAVDSEFRMSAGYDSRRIPEVMKSFINKNHPGSRFKSGNIETLKNNISDDDLYTALRDLFSKYVANVMYLSVQSKRSLDELQNLVVEKFSDLKSGIVASKTEMSLDEIFKPQFYTKMVFIKPISKVNKLYMSWYLNSLDRHYKVNPLAYLKHIFNHESEGSIAKLLFEKKFATHVNFSSLFENSMFSVARLSVELTDDGLENVDLILKDIFSYLLMIKESSVKEHERLYNEYKEKSMLKFKFHKELSPRKNVTDSVNGIKYFEETDILKDENSLNEFDEKVIFDVINFLNKRKFNLTIVTNEHESFNKKEKYFGVEFDEIDFPEKYQRLWDERTLNPEFFLEKPNPYKATNFEIYENVEESPKYPVKIYESDIYEVWHKLDNIYKLPYGIVCINMISSERLSSLRNNLLLILFDELATDHFSKKFSQARNVGYQIYLNVSETGYYVELSGFNEKLPLIVQQAINELITFMDSTDESTFQLKISELKKIYLNNISRPSSISRDYVSKITKETSLLRLEKYHMLESISLDDVKKFFQLYFHQLKVQVLIQGNVTKMKALEIVETMENKLTCVPLDNNYEPKPRVIQLPGGSSAMRLIASMSEDDNSVSKIYYQIGPITIQRNSLLKLLRGVLKSHAFEYLRTKEQLGYNVGLQSDDNEGVLSLEVNVYSQENKHNFTEVLEKMNFFIDNIAAKLIKELSDDDFNTIKTGIIRSLIAPKERLSQEVSENWNAILKLNYFFDRDQICAEFIKNVSKEELQEFFNSITGGVNMRKLIVQVIGNTESKEVIKEKIKNLEPTVGIKTEGLTDTERIITNISEFQRGVPFYPSVYFKNE